MIPTYADRRKRRPYGSNFFNNLLAAGHFRQRAISRLRSRATAAQDERPQMVEQVSSLLLLTLLTGKMPVLL